MTTINVISWLSWLALAFFFFFFRKTTKEKRIQEEVLAEKMVWMLEKHTTTQLLTLPHLLFSHWLLWES